LLSAGIPVVRLGAYHSYSDIFRNIEIVGQVVGNEQNAQSVLNRFSGRIAMVKSKVAGQPRPRVLYFEMSGYTAGPGSLVDEMITLAGGFNVIRETGFGGSHKLSQELAIGLEPDVIIVSGWSPKGERRPARQLMTNPVWQDVPAIKNRRVYDVPGSWAISNSQFSAEGLEHLAVLLHPEAFNHGL
jgi:iron complex transport system substrate-binding protein